MILANVVLLALLGSVSSKDVTRSKRQMNVYYMCGNYPNTYVSQNPCYGGNGCGYSTCSGLSTVGILPTSFYSPYNNCNSGCNNLNCNQYNGMRINGQYVAYSYGSNVYSPCASSCCSGYNNNNFYNNGWNNYNNEYNPYLTMGPGPVVGTIGQGVGGNMVPPVVGGIGLDGGMNLPQPVVGGIGLGGGANMPNVGGIGLNAVASRTGFNSFAVSVCGGSEASNGICNNGFCSDGFVCVQGNNCCRCHVGASSGQCSNGLGCTAGFTCMPNGYCCATSPYQGGAALIQCVNNACPSNYNCGTGNLCYPIGK